MVNIGSQIKTGGDLGLVSGGDQLYLGAKLESGKDLTLDSGGSITFEAVKDVHKESHDKSSSSAAWTSMERKGQVDETLSQSQLIAKGQTLINAVDVLHIDINYINQHSVSQAIDAMVQADSSMAWLKDAEARGDVGWRRVKELHDSWDESHSGLGGPAMIVIIIIVSYFTAGAASGALGTAASAIAGSGSAMSEGLAATASSSAVAAGWANATLTAMITSAASTAAVSTINNKGNLGAALKETFSIDNLKNYIVAGGTAGLTAGFFNDWTSTTTDQGVGLTDSTNGVLANTGKVAVTTPSGLSSLEGIAKFTENQLLQNSTSAVLNKALGRDGSLGDALQSSLVNAFAAYGFNLVGDIGKDYKLPDGELAKISLHAVMGGLASLAAGGDFKTGALAAGVNEAFVDKLASAYAGMPKEQRDQLLLMNSQLIGVLTTTVLDPDADTGKLQTGAWVAQSGTQYNFLNHEVDALVEELKGCRAAESPDVCRSEVKTKYTNLSDKSTNAALNGCKGETGCNEQLTEVQDGTNTLNKYVHDNDLSPEERDIVEDLADKNIHDLHIAHAIWVSQFNKEVAPVVLSGGGGAAIKVENGVGKTTAAEAAGAKGAGEATSLANAAKLRGQLTGQEISSGHAFEKHVVQQGEYRALGITTREQFASHIESVVNNPSSFRELSGGRTAYWDNVSGTVVIRNPKAVDGGTAFRPVNGQAYFDGLR